ncbi:helix-turn-helix transcriptional regulator [Dyella japonica]|uniref:AraC family transcriptional regulator n=1 Tax=Dyella japonica DSM 16301 TaxID=1440762 RepID=A0A0G9GXA3_9GAMM|nr:AraC family transcriptional regulator [Dyella japonica]KLD61953.1 AraC family transcriptional regulator [Dyella japonica DSM 16301]
MSSFSSQVLLSTETLTLRDVHCSGTCRHRSAEECAASTQLEFPYRGLYLRHVASDQTVADANHVLFFNAQQGYQVSHPLQGGDACLSLRLSDALLAELAPKALVQSGEGTIFRAQSQRIDARAQALVALLRHNLEHDSIEPLEAEALTLTLVCRSLGPRTSRAPTSTHARRRLADRVKMLLASDLSRRWTLAEIGQEIGGSPVYLTQVFKQVEGMPLYRYQLQLRLARALDRLGKVDDLSALAAELGFSSHSHFANAFRQAYGRSPTEFRQASRGPA